eukprot:10744161-Prorocentrum_lima.AAC.1
MCIRDRYVGGLERTVDAIKDELMKWASAPMEPALSASSNPFGEEAFQFEAAPAEAILAQPVLPEVSTGLVGEDANSN